jgi:hypothetical protein
VNSSSGSLSAGLKEGYWLLHSAKMKFFIAVHKIPDFFAHLAGPK